jgi:hypothetical protein
MRQSATLAAVLLVAAPAFADSDWCEESGYHDHRDRHCEVREIDLPASVTELVVDAAPNGGIRVEGWDRDEVRLIAKVVAGGRDEAAARELAAEVHIDTDGVVRASGPHSGWREIWSVSYRAWVPRRFDLDLRSTNGGLSVENVTGTISLDTRNGGLKASNLGGDVRGQTTNGGLAVELTGDRWDGRGLDLRTSNGGIVLEVPEPYSARLETRTTNGGLRIDFPVLLHGDLRRGLNLDLGEGGAPVRLVTTNGGVVLRRP